MNYMNGHLRNEPPEAKILSNNAFETLISFRKTLVECMKITKIFACGTRDLYNITEFSLLQKRDNRRKCNSPIHDNHMVIAFEIRIDKLLDNDPRAGGAKLSPIQFELVIVTIHQDVV